MDMHNDIVEEQLNLLAQEHVPSDNPLHVDITDLLSRKRSKELSCDQVKDLYDKHVIAGLDSPGQADIHGHSVSEADFVNCFQPTGSMDYSVMRAQFLLWKYQWKADNKPHIIISEENLVGLGEENRTEILRKELDGNIKDTGLIFVPLQDQDYWFLLVVDIDQNCGHVLNPDKETSVYHSALGIFDAVCSHLLKMGVQTSTSTWLLLFMRGLEKLEDSFESGIHVLMYIEGFERRMIYDYVKEEVSLYRKKIAVSLVHRKENRMRPSSGKAADSTVGHEAVDEQSHEADGHGRGAADGAEQESTSESSSGHPSSGKAAGDSSSLVVSTSAPESVQGETVRPALQSVQGEAMPTAGSALESVQGGDVLNVPEQQESTAKSSSGAELPVTIPEQQESTSESSSGAEDNSSRKRNAEKVSEFEKSAAKRTRGMLVTTLVERYTKEPEGTSSKLYDLVCSEKFKGHEIISIGGISFMAEFISGGVLSKNILQAFTECLMYDEGNGKKNRMFLAPQDYEKDKEKFKDNIAKTLPMLTKVPQSFWTTVMIFLPVWHGNEWIVYCASNRVSMAVSFRERIDCAETRQAQRQYIMTVLQDAINDKYFSVPGQKSKQKFARKHVSCPKYADGLTGTPHKHGLVALQFMEFYSGAGVQAQLGGIQYCSPRVPFLPSEKHL